MTSSLAVTTIVKSNPWCFGTSQLSQPSQINKEEQKTRA